MSSATGTKPNIGNASSSRGISEFALSPFYHPTTIVLVDDNQTFLDSLDLDLDNEHGYRTFTQPEDALAYLNQPPASPPLAERCFGLDYHAKGGPTIQLDLNVLEQEVTRVERFQRNAVLIVDYAMPSMDGLELCAQLTDPYLMKAMLTGVADEKIAVAAFNAGLIHRFVPKHDAMAIQNISRFVAELQIAHFQQQSARLRSNLAINPPEFLVDEQIASFVQQLMRCEQLVEYYLVAEPDGLLLLDGAGTMLRLLVLDEQAMDAQLAYAQAHQAPDAVLQLIAKRERLCYFWDRPENYFGEEQYPWTDHLLKVNPIQGTKQWYLAIAEDPPIDVDFDPSKSSFEAFLAL